MSEMFHPSRPPAASGGVRVAAPCRGDMLSGALHRAFDGNRTIPDDFGILLAQLDRIATARG